MKSVVYDEKAEELGHGELRMWDAGKEKRFEIAIDGVGLNACITLVKRMARLRIKPTGGGCVDVVVSSAEGTVLNGIVTKET